ncbi:MAG: Nif-specific regulatory protein [Acidobacteriota bacterium]|nr:Nif-specific regulatory protein [Acidobacteriota bacterium]
MDTLTNPPLSLKKISVPYSDINLRQVEIIANLHSNLFQTPAYYNYNHFQIDLWFDADDEGEENATAIMETLDREVVEQAFVQGLALWNLAKKMELDFIDFSRWQLLPDPYDTRADQQRRFTVKFPIRLPLPGLPAEPGPLLACFQNNKYLQGVNEKNYLEFFHRLAGKYTFLPHQAYVYRYDEFASMILNSYSIDELQSEANIKIRIRAADQVQEKIIKRHLYRNYVAEGIFFVDLGKQSLDSDLPGCITRLISESDSKGNENNEGEQYLPDDPVSVIQRLDLFLKKSSFKSFVLLMDGLKSKEDAEFINYLAHSSGITNIILIVFDTLAPAPNGSGSSGCTDRVEFDLELNETPVNLLQDYIRFDKPGKKVPLRREARIASAENFRSQVEILVKQGETNSAAALIHANMEKDPVFLKLKLGQVYRVEKDHPRMHTLLEEIKTDINEPWQDEFYYLNFIYCEKISDVRSADRYLKKIKNPLFVHLANIKLSDRYIYQGQYEKAENLLNEAIIYLAENKYPWDEIDACTQWAKLLRQKKEFGEAEKLYKNLFIKSEMKNLGLLSGYITVDLGNLYFSRDDFSQAEAWYRKTLKIFRNHKNRNGVILAESNLVEINKIKGNWQETKTQLKSILAYDKERESLDAVAIDYVNIAHLEYLKHNDSGAREYLRKALNFFEERKNAAGIIECTLLNLKLTYLFQEGVSGVSTSREYPVPASAFPGKYREHMTHDQEILFSLFTLLMPKEGAASATSVTSASSASSRQAGFAARVKDMIERIESRLLRFEIITLCVLAGCPGKTGLLELLKSLSMQLSRKTRNYHFYEYFYVYFNDRLEKDKRSERVDIDDGEKSIFMDMYYFFLRNKRKLSPAVIDYKNRLEEKDSAYDVFRSADLVGDYVHWKIPEDFFDSLVKELKKVVPVDRVQLVIYEHENKTPVFRFSSEARFKEITAEIMDHTPHGLEDLNLTLENIKQSFKSSEKAFYYYRNTKVLLWKLSDTLFGVLLLGFLTEDYFDFDLKKRRPELLKNLASLIHKYYENDFKVNHKLNWLIGQSPAMKRLKEQILKVSKVDFALLIRGESGSGKDLAARAVHLLSKRAGKPFVPVNAAAIPENLLEAELFGYKKGAFTGAAESKTGLIETANQGTLFLDEIADLPLTLQAKLLRVLQENEIRRLGETHTVKVDFRLICATNKDLKKLIQKGEFREDLFFRIQDLTIDVPSLGERLGDIPLLARHFLEKYKFPVRDEGEIQRVIQWLEGRVWAGNVRELESTVKRMITYYPDFEMESGGDFPCSSVSISPGEGVGLIAARESLERGMVLHALQENDWNQQRAARSLKITRQYIGKLMKKYGIKDPAARGANL